MNFAEVGPLLNEKYEHGKVADVTLILHDDLDLFEYLQDVAKIKVVTTLLLMMLLAGRTFLQN